MLYYFSIQVDSVKKIQAGNAFINFVSREGAEMAINAVDEKVRFLYGDLLERTVIKRRTNLPELQTETLLLIYDSTDGRIESINLRYLPFQFYYRLDSYPAAVTNVFSEMSNGH